MQIYRHYFSRIAMLDSEIGSDPWVKFEIIGWSQKFDNAICLDFEPDWLIILFGSEKVQAKA